MALRQLSTEELIKKLVDAGVEITAEEAQRFRENDVDGETVDCGLTEAMIAYLFDKSFKKLLKFRDFVSQHKEVILSLDDITPDVENLTQIERKEPVCQRLPAVMSIPCFPKDVQSRLDAKESCQKVPRDRNKIIRTLYEMMAQYTMYPTNAEYVQVAKALIVKYPFLKDVEGNGYHTWHMSLKRKFKAERAPLLNDTEVKKFKEKFHQARKSTDGPETLHVKRTTFVESCIVGEDATSVEAHVKALHEQYRKTQPDLAIVKDRMKKTFAWRRREISEGMTVTNILMKYPFLRTSSGLYDEVDAIHPLTVNICRRFNEGFTALLPNLLKLVKGTLPLKKLYVEAREEALAEDLPGIDFRGVLVFLPSIFRENIDHLISLGEGEPATPYPTIQLKDKDWKTAISRRSQSVVKVDGVEVCTCAAVDEAFITTFCMYFTFNIAYPPRLRNTMTFLQRCILHIKEEGDKPLPVTVTRVMNLL
ncbi:sterile alpha motif domain-containing protein 3-like [Astyanax mexicanus]|uniref:Sterile alpha motif domain-containing protein 3-like n=1 Tax=Astyanax mexicanus TaxID=7994 RepID=A0A8T2MCV2_ASTMX|nr:sterile alpha motif domain-containing protein 3-like [Astyanax mexicanus]